MKVSLISTVKDAGAHIGEFLASIEVQTRPPDEVVIVDGGSTDGTWERLRAEPGIHALREPGAGIGRGRNVAIRAAAHDLIAVTDADCLLEPDWLEHLVEPVERGTADVAAGFYRPLATSLFEVVSAAVSVPERDELDRGWMPSSRSVAFRREVFDAAGGYPEWLEVGEDMYLNHRLQERGARFELTPDAVVWWRIRPTLTATWRQYARYSEGDALAGMYPHRHALRFGVYAGAAFALATRRRSLLTAAALGGAAYAWKPLRRTWTRLAVAPERRPAAVAMVAPMMAFVDAAKMWGYARGLLVLRGTRGRVAPAEDRA